MSIKINDKNLSKMYIGTPITDATKIQMSSTDSKTVAEAINENRKDMVGIIDNFKILEKNLESKAATINYEVIADTNWQGSKSPFSKVIEIIGLKGTDTPIVDLVTSEAYETSLIEVKSYSKIYKANTSNNAITFYATEKPSVILKLQLKVVR
nr:hypothetical protein [uncultured Aminipila sp.]